MEIFGSLERFLSEDLYPYRVPVTLVAALALAAATWLAARRGWLTRLTGIARRRPVASSAVALILVLTVLPAGYYLASPLWTRTTLIEESPIVGAATASSTGTAETMPGSVQPTDTAAIDPSVTGAVELPRTVLSGEWMGADDFHFARGEALIIEVETGSFVLRLQDFSVRNGPDLFVYLSPDPAGFADGAIELGGLKATDGAFNYQIPAGTPLEQVRSAVVWCKQFGVLFGTAPLQ